MCIKHQLRLDIVCEDCDEFICSQYAKKDHKDHDWKTKPTTVILRRREQRRLFLKIRKKICKRLKRVYSRKTNKNAEVRK